MSMNPVPSLNRPPQTVPQLIPAGVLVTVPATLPDFSISNSIDVMELHETLSKVVPTIGVPPAGVKLAEMVLVPQPVVAAVPVFRPMVET